MKKVLVAVAAATLSLGALAFEKYMMRVPDELNPKEGINGVTTYFFAPAAVSIPLRDGTSVYVVNETHKLPSKDATVQIGVPKKVVDLDVISRYRDAMKGFPSIAVQFGESTFFAYHCGAMFPAPDGLYVDNCYQGVVVSMGLEYSITVYLPKGRGLDAEVREVLKKIRFVPLPGVGVDTALKLYGEGSAVPAAARLKTITKMVEERGECCELIELLSTLTGDAATKAWCMERLKFLNPGKYAPDARTEIAAYDSNNDAQQNAVMAMLGATDKAEKASVKVPAASAETGVSFVAANKTKTITLPGGATMEFIWCEKGVFTMGQNDGEWDPSKDEEPRRKITLTKGFWLAKYETTQGQWKSVMGANPSHFTGDDALPVEMVSWKSCQEFAEKAGAALGAKMRLPTEAEWEYACRAGTRTTYYWGYQPSTAKANYDGTDSFHPERSLPTIGKTVKVGSYEPNAWGLFDMAGNVAEWCEDDWQEKPSAGNATDPLHRDGTQSLKVYRGGAWRGQNFTCRSAERSWFSSANERDWLGVRFLLEETAGKPDAQERVPPASAASGDVATPPSQGRAGAPRPPQTSATTAAKTKTVTLPGGATMEMIYCPPGTYMMGSREDSPGKESHDVCPQIKVTLTKGFWLGKYEVTQAQWKSVMGANPSDPESSGDDLPVNNMSWDDAASFVKKVGGGARLPTDAEWEYACKAGTDTVFHWGDTCNGTEANCNGTKPFGTEKKGPNIGHAVKVGSYAPNAWGFHDMAGNVAEWCSDRHKDYYITHPKELTDPKGGDSSVRYRTVRGGCFYSYWRAVDCRSVKRDLCPPDVTRAYVGFRLAMDDDGEGTVDTQNAVAKQSRAGAPRPTQGNVAPNKTKTITLPGGAKMEMIYCPPGTYTMGSPETENWRDESLEHQIKVTLTKGFWLGKYEVTQKQWKSVMGTNPSSDVGDDLPVGGLKWLDTCEFVRKVGNGARLPKEAEWEYACRAGTATAFPWGDSCNGNEANCNGEWPYGTKEKGPKLGKPAKGGSYPPNAWGFCDMNGNMSEWCSDFFKIWPKEEKELVDPEGMSGGTSKALRGGSFYDAAKFCRSASRKGFVPDSGQPHLGFRLAMSE